MIHSSLHALRPAACILLRPGFQNRLLRNRSLSLGSRAVSSQCAPAAQPNRQRRGSMPFMCPDQPRYHIAPASGWINDPNGPFFWKGLWHMFYQYLPGSSKWDWGLLWGHAVSRDKVHWKELPPAIMPTPGGLDQDGVFSGCACIEEETGTPVLLYTGVRLRSSPTCGPLPPPQFDLNLPFIESQLAAWPADLDDPLLQVWVKSDMPILGLPPPNMDLAGWRDPFIISTPSTSLDGTYKMVVGSGIKGKGGLVPVYKSRSLRDGWQFDKWLCEGKQEGATGVTGIMWEMPLLMELPPLEGPVQAAAAALDHSAIVARSEPAFTPAAASAIVANSCAPHSSPLRSPTARATSASTSAGNSNSVSATADDPATTSLAELPSAAGSTSHPRRWFFSISPDACTSPTLYWVGNCPTIDTFDLHNAAGPHKFDLGDILYAPQLVKDPEGRVLLMTWQQEKRKVGEYTYAGCMSVPRMLSLDWSDPSKPYLVQQPLPELVQLRVPGKQYVLGAAVPPSQQLHARAELDEATTHPLQRSASSHDPAAEAGWQEGGRAQRHAAMMMEDEYAATGSPQPGDEQAAGRRTTGVSTDLGAGPANGDANGPPHSPIHSKAGRTLEVKGSPGAVPAAAAAATGSKQQGKGTVRPTLLVGAGQSVTIPVVSGPFLDIEVALMPADPAEGILRSKAATGQGSGTAQQLGQDEAGTEAGLMSGLALRSWVSGGSAAVLYSWREGTLEVVFEATDPNTHKFSLAAPDVRRVGGPLMRPPAPGEPLRLRLLLDGSLLEIFTGSGEALSTRVYRGVPPAQDGISGTAADAMASGIDPITSSGVDLISVGGSTVVKHLEAHEMKTIWEEDPMLQVTPALPDLEQLLEESRRLVM